MRHTARHTSPAVEARFTWQRDRVPLARAPWLEDPRQQAFVITSVSVAEDLVPQYALMFSVAVLVHELQQPHTSGRGAPPQRLRVVRRVTKQHMASAFERAVSARTPEDARFAQLRTRPLSKRPLLRDIDDTVRQWLLQGSAAPSREEITLWLLARMILVCSIDDDMAGWSLLICGEPGAELQLPPFVRSSEQTTKKHKQSVCDASAADQGDNGDESDGEEDQPPAYSEYRSVNASNLLTRSEEEVEEDVDADAAEERSDSSEFEEAASGGDERAAPESQLQQDPLSRLSSPSAWEKKKRNTKRQLLEGAAEHAVLAATVSSSVARSASHGRSTSERFDATPAATTATEPHVAPTKRPTMSGFTFEPASTRVRHRSSSNRSARSTSVVLDADLTNEWTQDRRSFQLELCRSRKDIECARELQRRTEAIAHARKQQLLAQSQRKLRAHDQRKEDSRRVGLLVADALEYHEILHTLKTQTKRTEISAKREHERLTQSMRVALGRSERHVKGPVLGSGPLSQREIDAFTLSHRHRRSSEGGSGAMQLETDSFVYDLHGRRHPAEDAGDVAALGVFEAAMHKIKRVLDRPGCDAVQLFRKFDTDRSGALSYDEFERVLCACGATLSSEQARVLFAHFDPNCSGAVDYGELLWGFFNRRAFVKKWQQRRTKLSAREVKLLFYQYDRTGRGALSLADFQLAMGDIGFALTEPELRLLVLKFDANGDGFIDYHEFHAFVSNGDSDGDVNGDDTTPAAAATVQDSGEDSSKRSAPRVKSNSSSSRSISQHGDASVERIYEELRALSETQTRIRQVMRK